MKISIITMSRKRPKYLLKSLESFISKASNNKDIEYVSVIDDDDMETKGYTKEINELAKKYNADIQTYETPRLPLEQYLNTGASVATGDVFFFIADDVFCEKEDWDLYMSDACEKYLDEPFLIWTVGINESWKPHPTHFGISKKWYEIANLITCHRSSDECVRDLALEANLRTIKLLDWYMHKQRHKKGTTHRILEGALEYDQVSFELANGYEGMKPSMSRKVDVGSNSNQIGTKQLYEQAIEKLKNWRSYEK